VVDLSGMQLEQGIDTWPVAGDIQRSTKAGPLKVELGQEAKHLTAYFEPAPAAVSKGLTLVLPIGQDTVELPLQ